MPNTLLIHSRRALAATAVALLAAACGQAPTAPGGAPRARAASDLAKQQPEDAAARGRRGGYNVVAD